MTGGWLHSEVQLALADGGAVSQVLTGFHARPEQGQMAEAVVDAMERRGALVVEAGTGTGKTFGYLIPALLSGRRVLISSATKALQDQLFRRDLPDAIRALGLPLQTALLKGRANYLCLHRLAQSRQQSALPDRLSARVFARVEQWAQSTSTGDLSELPGLDERSPVIPLVTSTRDNCLGSECPQFQSCHVVRARRQALAADVAVINHHLFFADLTLRETGMAELLPTVDVLIFDEAHQLPEAGVQFLGQTLSTAALQDLARDVLAAGLQHARGLADWGTLAAGMDKAARDWRLVASSVLPERSGQRLPWQNLDKEPKWVETIGLLGRALTQAVEAIESVAELAPDFAKLQARCAQVQERLALFNTPTAVSRVRWVDLTPQHIRVTDSPLDVRDEVGPRALSGDKTWVFTSATLGEDDQLGWFVGATALEGATTLRLASPFDYPRQAALHVPATFAAPNSPEHAKQVAGLVAEFAGVLGGRTFVLTTTLRSLKAVGEHLRRIWAEADTSAGRADSAWDDEWPEVLVQGDTPKRLLLERFLECHGPGRRGAVLVGSASFWEGIDVPGDALQLVVIDKLPFPPPNDPLVEARCRAIEAGGGNPFRDYFLGEAAMALKQGAGRLIRRETDSGLLVVTDARLRTANYGQRLLASLPPMKRIGRSEEALAFVRHLRESAVSDA
jgi:ATP-dependent DNA helicase DinG